MLPKMKIHEKLLLGFGVVLFILVSILGFCLWQIDTLNRSYSGLVDKQAVKVHDIQLLHVSLLRLSDHVQGYVMTGDKEYLRLVNDEKENLAGKIPTLQENLAAADPTLMNRFLHNYDYYLNNYVNKVIAVKTDSLTADPGLAPIYEDQIFLLNLMKRGLFGCTVRAMNDIIAQEQQILNVEKHKNYDLVGKLSVLTILAGLFGLGGGGACAYGVVSSVTTEIKRRRQTEKELQEEREMLRRTNERLEKRVRERTAHLSRAVDMLKRDITKRERVEKALRRSENEAQQLLRKVRVEVAQREKTEEVLRESEERFRCAFENAGIGMALVDAHGGFIKVNDSFDRIVGYTRRELFNSQLQDLLHTKDKRGYKAFRKLLLACETQVEQREVRFIHKKGSVIWVLLNASIVRDDKRGFLYLIVQIQDITDRRRAEEEILRHQKKLRSLASEITLAEERERRRIATGLHDHLGQNLAVAKMRLQAVREVDLPAPLEKPLREISQIVEESIDHVRHLTFRLSPPILYELGLKEGIAWLAEQVRDRHGIRVGVKDYGLPSEMGDEIKVVLFQSVRELLNNIVKYAQVESAAVCLGLQDDFVFIVVQDEGVGFNPGDREEAQAHNQDTFGLFNIQERLTDLGGRMDIQSKPGAGTRVRLTVPGLPATKGGGHGGKESE